MMLESEEDFHHGIETLIARDPEMAALLAVAGRPKLRRNEAGFSGLAGIIVSQQLSTASANAIWGKVTARFPGLTAEMIHAASDEELRSVGLSSPKIRALRAAATAVSENVLPLDEFAEWPADAAHRKMIEVKGIGPWTADIYLLFCLGHPDAFPTGDLALQEAVRIGFKQTQRLTAKELELFAERWRPVRGVAAILLWAYYGVVKSGKEPLPAGTSA
jgi:DNA-3-methyladenine glycosylase II